jgi:DNA-binding NarL/FixJ family response regulator
LDDHAVVRYGIALRLSQEPDIAVVGNYENSRSMIAGLRAVPADVLLVDYSLGPSELDGVSLIRALRLKFPQRQVLVFSSLYHPATVALALRVGARGFAGKTQDMDKILGAIRTVASGAVYLDPEMSYRLADIHITEVDVQDDAAESPAQSRLIAGAPLSVREREVIRCFLDGMTVSQIAHKFGRSAKTISTQKSTAFRKLGITTDNGLFKIKHMLEES